MIERYELSLFAKYGDLVEDLLPKQSVASDVIVLRGTVGDAILQRLTDLESQLRRAGLGGTFAGWKIKRSCAKGELAGSELFLLKPPFTHLSAEEYGTVYTESDTCRQTSYGFEFAHSDGSQIRAVPRLVPCGL